MENTILTFDGFTFNTETRQITFTQKVCGHCKGNCLVEKGILCPRYGQKVAHLAGRKCEHCGAKNRDSHKSIGTQMVKCRVCDGTGMENCNEYSSLNMSGLIQFINIVTLKNLRSATFNENYLGLGIIGGCTDYGRYLTETGADYQEILAHVRKETEKRNRYTQALNLITADGKLIETAVLKMNDSGWSLFSVGAIHSQYSLS